MMRTASERIVEAVWSHLGTVLDAFSPQERQN